MRFSQVKSDNSLYMKKGIHGTVFILVYVDDMLITGDNSEEINRIVHKLDQNFAIKDLGELKKFLGIQVIRKTNGELILSQQNYITEILQRANMHKANPLPTPMISNLRLSKHKGEAIDNAKQYRSIIGALQYATITRPDICYSVNKLSQYMQNPLSEHWMALKRVLRYLQGTKHYGIRLNSEKERNLQCFSDADWANDIDDRKSVSGYCVYLGSNIISWCTKKQQTTSRSSTEAEYRALASATAEIMWIESLMEELGFTPRRKPVIWCDNKSTISLSLNSNQHSRTKHLEIDLHFVRERTQSGRLAICHVPAYYQRADALTKVLSTKIFIRMREELRVISAGGSQNEQGNPSSN